MTDSTQNAKPTIRSRLHGDIQFATPEEFRDWTNTQVEFWRSHVPKTGMDAASVSSVRGVADHIREWEMAASNVTRAVNVGTTQDIDRAQLTDAATIFATKLDNHNLILASSSLAAKLEELLNVDAEAFATAICLYTGNNLGRVIIEDQGMFAWRSVPTIIDVFSRPADGQVAKKIDALVKSVGVSESSVRTIENELREQLKAAEEVIKNDEEKRRLGLDELYTEFGERLNDNLDAAKQRCADLEEYYRHKQALSAPREYWEQRRTFHRGQAKIWGGVSVALVVGILVTLAKDWFTPLARARDVLVVPSGQSPNWTAALPELALIAAAAFLTLWTLRFAVRQTAQHLARWEEAAQRVTMVSTFLALADYHTDGKSSLVSEADRAVMIQALFRPSGLQSPDDAPPSHWIEDVLKRLTEAAKKDEP